jgi:hypothetical protein
MNARTCWATGVLVRPKHGNEYVLLYLYSIWRLTAQLAGELSFHSHGGQVTNGLLDDRCFPASYYLVLQHQQAILFVFEAGIIHLLP